MKKAIFLMFALGVGSFTYSQPVSFDSLDSNLGYDKPLVFNMNNGLRYQSYL